MTESETFTAFAGHRCIAAGELFAVAQAIAGGREDPILIFEDATGRPVELDLRQGAEHAVADYARRRAPAETPAGPQGRGRPRLGVVAREVTLLPRHWAWLATQPGGASATLRRLIEEARRTSAGPDRARQAQEVSYRVMSALAGDLPGYEEALRALFAGDDTRLDGIVATWPADVAAYVSRQASAARDARAEA